MKLSLLKKALLSACAACAAFNVSAYEDARIKTDDDKVGFIELDDSYVYVFTNTVHAFNVTAKAPLYLEKALVVAGGGSGGGTRGGGGGAGGLWYEDSFTADEAYLEQGGIFRLLAGAGGARIAKGSWNNGNSGKNSTLSYNSLSVTMLGGGYGGGFSGAYQGGTGGSGGGGCNTGAAGLGTVGQGHDGYLSSGNQVGGAGGGAGGAGVNQTPGPGVVLEITGESVEYAKGGAGGVNGSIDAGDAPDGTGEGGRGGYYGGGSVWGTSGGKGGDGAVILRFAKVLPPVIAVGGFPAKYLADKVDYSLKADCASGTKYTFSAVSGGMENQSLAVECTGWKLYRISDMTLLNSGTEITDVEIEFGTEALLLEWQWAGTWTPPMTVFDGGSVSNIYLTSDIAQIFDRAGTYTIKPKQTISARVLAVGGGGAGGGCIGGGGGGGEVVDTVVTLNAGTSYTITVGAGGTATASTGATGYCGGNGGNTTVGDLITALGGGGGGGWSAGAGASGANGGGGANGGAGGSATAVGGNAGAACNGTGNNALPGGGGGMGGAPTKGSNGNRAGNGGDGVYSDILGADEADETAWFGAGGGGGTGNHSSISGTGGFGFGGDGVSNSDSRPWAEAIVDSTGLDGHGSGGGGGAYVFTGNISTAGAGGCGVVIIRYTSNVFQSELLEIADDIPGEGVVSSAFCSGLADGTNFTIVADGSWTNETHTVAKCAAWTLYDESGNSVASGSGASCQYTHQGQYRKLVWRWLSAVTDDFSGIDTPVASQLFVTGTPEAYRADGEPFYGSVGGLVSGDTLEFTATNGIVTIAGGLRTYVTGWKLYRFNSASGEYELESQSAGGTKYTCAYTHSVTGAKLVWEWAEPYIEASGLTRTWTGLGADNLASTAANWDTGVPASGDVVALDGATAAAQKNMTWDLPQVVPAEWTQSGYTGTVTIATTYGSQFPVFHVVGDVEIVSGTWTQQKNPNTGNVEECRLNVKVGGDFTLGSDARLSADGCGFGKDKGPSAGTASDRGGSYGGASVLDKCYGSIKRPTNLGSGSNSSYNSNNAQAGGAIRLEVTGDAVLNGTVSANGGYTTTHASPAGGSVWVTAAHITGNGLITANGGVARDGWGSTGCGGRISLVQTAGDAVRDAFTGQVRAIQKTNSNTDYGAPGTIYDEIPSDLGAGRLTVSNITSSAGTGMAFTELNTIMEQDFDFGEIRLLNYANLRVQPGVTLNLAGVKMTGDGTGRLYLTDADSIALPNEYTWTNVNVCCVGEGATFAAAETTTVGEKATVTCGIYPINVPGDLFVSDGGVITHFGVGSTGQQKVDLVVDGNLVIDSTSMIHAHNSGMSEYTTGLNQTTGASSHGGLGRTKGSYTYRDLPLCYGSIYNPLDYGSKGRIDQGGYGGGVIRLNVGGKLTVDGLITASATTSPYEGGSGGSVNITCGEIDGTGAWGDGWGGIWAQGSQAWYDCRTGGGGRIAITLTNETATMANFTGHLSARGLGASGLSGVYKPTKAYFSNAGSTRYGGAGTVYIREKNAAEDEGMLIIDNDATLATTAEGAITQINAEKMEGFSYGKVILRNGGRLWVKEGVTVETSAFDNGAEKPGLLMSDPLAVVKLVGDDNGLASISGDVEFSTLVIDSSVTRLVVSTGSTVTVSSALTASGSEGSLLAIESSDSDGTFNLNVSASASTSLDYLKVKNCVATGAKLSPEHSEGEGNTEGWKFVTIIPGTVVTWTGASSDAWSDAGNWDVERVPVKTDIVVIPAEAENMPTLPQSDVTVSNLMVESGASLTAAGFGLTVGGGFTLDGAFTAADDETITVNGVVSIGSGAAFTAANSTFVVGGTSAALGGKTFYRILFNGQTAVAGGLNATEFEVAAGSSLVFRENSIETYSAIILRVNGTADAPVTLASRTPGEKWLFKLRGYSEVDHAVVRDSDASAGATVYASNATLTDCVNWVAPDVRYVWSGAASTDFANAANWLVGGVAPESAPGAESDVIVDAADCANAPVVSSEAAVKSLTVISGALRVNAPMTVAGSMMAMDGTTLTIDKPTTIGGDFTALSGAALTHSKLPDADSMSESYRFDVTVGGDMTIEKGVTVDLSSKGYSTGKGPGSYHGRSYYYASHGGGTYEFSDPVRPTAACYDSIFAPTNCGSGGDGRSHSGNSTYGGGAFVAKVAGHFQLDSDILVNVNGASDFFAGAGGAAFITAGTLAGTGAINANGGMVSNGNSGGGGRVSLVLTDLGATFADYTGKVTAYGGSYTASYADPFDSKSARASCGTIYRQTGAQADGCGTIEIVNNPSSGDHYTDLGYGAEPNEKELRGALLEIGANARVRILSDIRVADLSILDGFSVLKLGGHTLRVAASKPAGWKVREPELVAAKKIVYGGTEEEPGKIVWGGNSTMLILR